MLFVILLLFILIFWAILKMFKTFSLLSRYNFRNGFGNGVNSEKARTFKELKQRVRDAKAWDKHRKAELKNI